ncbi:MAG: hypothetical protein KGJ09_09275 [Candidatus Omnitrophica bacterium]|nr:hypothetical protein [Candidatus Omnitrophota bacterium]
MIHYGHGGSQWWCSSQDQYSHFTFSLEKVNCPECGKKLGLDIGPSAQSAAVPPSSIPGLTLRAWFAGQALAGLLAKYGSTRPFASVAGESFLCADAMLGEMEKAQEKQAKELVK